MANPIWNRKTIYFIILSVFLIAGIYILVQLSPIFSKPGYLASDDFVRYWISGRLNWQGLNPFDPGLIQNMQNMLDRSVAWPVTTSITLNPPWVMPMIMLMASFSYPTSRLIWLLVSVLIILFSSQLLWSIYIGSKNFRWLAILVVFIFSPTISILEKGQITNLVLLGLVGFIFFVYKKRNDWLAGACLGLVAVKPQLVLLFWLAVFIWIIQQRRWVVMISAAATTILLTLVATIFDPHIIHQYINMLQSYSISDWANPTIGAYLRFFWIGTNQFWIQFLPTILGAFWLLYYLRKHGQPWDWPALLPIILFATIITSPYAWTYDQVILVPAIIQTAVWAVERWKSREVVISAVTYLALNFLNLILHMKLDDFWFIWFAPALLIWYLFVRHQNSILVGNLKTSGQEVG